MKKFFIVFLALILVACGAPAPTAEQPAATQALPEPTQTAAIVLQTVVVTVIPTQAPAEIPSATPLPPPTEVPATQVPPTEPPAATAAEANTSGGPITVDDTLGA